jgi:putative NADH-flavin reductase
MTIASMPLRGALLTLALLVLGSTSLVTAPAGAAEAQRIVIYGASGRVGSRIVNEALNRGHYVTAVTRDLSHITETRDRLTVVEGDVLDPESVYATVAGYDVVISAIGGSNPDSDDPMLSIPRLAAESLVMALRRLGERAPRLILVGGGSSTLDESPGVPFVDPSDPLTGPRAARVLGHRKALDLLRTTTDIKWTFLSPALEMRPGVRTGHFRVGDGIVIRDAEGQSTISMEDYAVAMIDEVENPQHINQRFNVAY